MITTEYNIYLKGKLYFDNGKYDKALEIFEKLYDNNTKDNVITFFYAKSLIKTRKNFLLAEHLLKSIINNNKRNNILFELGKLEKEKGNFYEARRYFYGLLKTSNKYYATYELLLLDIKLNNYEEAYELLQKLLEIEKDNKKTYGLKNIEFYLKQKLNILDSKDLSTGSYYCRQLLEYNKETAISHIEYYYKSLDIDSPVEVKDLFYLVENYLTEETFIKATDIDRYLILFETPIFTIKGKDIYALEVSTIINTKNILTIKPKINYTLTNDRNKNKTRIRK